MTEHPYPKLYFYKRLVQAKLFIDSHYAEPIDLDNIADEAFFRNSISSANSGKYTGTHRINT